MTTSTILNHIAVLSTPVALCIVMIGFSFSLGIEQLVMHLMHASDDCTLPAQPSCITCDEDIHDHSHIKIGHDEAAGGRNRHSDNDNAGAFAPEDHDHSHEHRNIHHGHDHAHSKDVTGCPHTVAVFTSHSTELRPGSTIGVQGEVDSAVVKKHSHGHTHSIQMTAGTTRENILTKVYILLVAIVTHTVIIAFEYGTLSEDEDLTSLKILLAAFSVHQLFEGITVGFFVASVYDVVGIVNVGYLTLLFSLSFPVGVILGTYTT